ncbi:MAG: hypothetical protein JEZ06_12145 [Anaerolineaceae bacterium]|nr:hypothetical protein [Anaerolineaceae bacterium]
MIAAKEQLQPMEKSNSIKNTSNNLIFPAIVSNDTISPNDDSHNEMLAKSGPSELTSEPQAVPALPENAMQTSGNSVHWKQITWNMTISNSTLILDGIMPNSVFRQKKAMWQSSMSAWTPFFIFPKLRSDPSPFMAVGQPQTHSRSIINILGA